MCENAVRSAVRETFFADPPKQSVRARPPRGERGACGIGRVLQALHRGTTEEPLPDEITILLDRLGEAETRR